ncbi:MAG: UDP-N-acetylglucosamine transferase subunit ALG14 [Streptococcaceae bacterium]|nr:UDP-N-acetylglucosamine transferase subunit ALG14 [Streptococcaceae bacterium]
MKKVMFISSTGGHLTELLQLKAIFSYYDYRLVTEKTEANFSLKATYDNRVSFLKYGTKHHLLAYAFIFPYNCLKSLAIFLKYQPSVVVTTGAHTAVPMCYIAKLFRRKVIYIETFANIESKSLSGRLVYPIADVFVVQWESMLKMYPKAKLGGWIF